MTKVIHTVGFCILYFSAYLQSVFYFLFYGQSVSSFQLLVNFCCIFYVISLLFSLLSFLFTYQYIPNELLCPVLINQTLKHEEHADGTHLLQFQRDHLSNYYYSFCCVSTDLENNRIIPHNFFSKSHCFFIVTLIINVSCTFSLELLWKQVLPSSGQQHLLVNDILFAPNTSLDSHSALG